MKHFRTQYQVKAFVPPAQAACNDVTLAAQFVSANTEYLDIADNASFDLSSGSFSFSAWVYLDSLPANNQEFFFVCKDGPNFAAAQREYGLLITNDAGTITFRFYNTNGIGGPTFYIVDADTFGTPSINTWYFLTGIHDATAQKNYISVNNGPSDEVASTANPPNGTNPFRISSRGNDSFLMNGRIGGVGFWTKALTAEERTRLYNSGKGLVYAGLSGSLLTSLTSYWNLDEFSGNRADSAGTNTLTDNNTVTNNRGPSDSCLWLETTTSDKWQPNTNIPRFDKKRYQFQYPTLFIPDQQPEPRMDTWFKETERPRFDRKRWQFLYQINFPDPSPRTTPTLLTSFYLIIKRRLIQYQRLAEPLPDRFGSFPPGLQDLTVRPTILGTIELRALISAIESKTPVSSIELRPPFSTSTTVE